MKIILHPYHAVVLPTKLDREPSIQQEAARYDAIQNLKNRTQKYNLSPASFIKLRKNINLMGFMRQQHYIYNSTPHSKRKYGSFVTLTLPCKQMHETNFLNRKLLNDFLNIMRNTYHLRTYAWRLEFQQNGNAHWHFVMDENIKWYYVRNAWNNCLAKYGYIAEYSRKFGRMNIDEYIKYRNKNDLKPKNNYQNAFLYGKKTAWTNPNTIDCQEIKNHNMLRKYLSKYISKNNTQITNGIYVSKQRDHNLFRLVGFSRNLSNQRQISISMGHKNGYQDYLWLLKNSSKVINCDYADVIIYDLKKRDFYKRLGNILYEEHFKTGYFN